MSLPNILLIVLDSVNQKGMKASPTPFLDSASDWASVYEQTRAPAIWTVPSHATLWTGLFPDGHGVVGVDQYLDSTATIWHRLNLAGYDTGLFTSNGLLAARNNGLDDPFDTVLDRKTLPFPEASLPHDNLDEDTNSGIHLYLKAIRNSIGAQSPAKTFLNGVFKFYEDNLRRTDNVPPDQFFVDQFLDWQHNQKEPWAACLNLMDAHIPYLAGKDEPRADVGDAVVEAEAFQSELPHNVYSFLNGDYETDEIKRLLPLYHAAIGGIDRHIQRIVSTLKSRSAFEDTLMVVVGDHGEGFGEQSRIDESLQIVAHRMGIHECLLHVPLIIKYPGQDSGRTVEELTSLTEFKPIVEECIEDGIGDPSPIVTEVYSTDPHPRSDEGLSAAMEWCDDDAPFRISRRAIYEQCGDGSIVKHMEQTGIDEGRIARSIQITPTNGGSKLEDDVSLSNAEFVERFDQLEPADIHHTISEGETVSAKTRERLEELGYL